MSGAPAGGGSAAADLTGRIRNFLCFEFHDLVVALRANGSTVGRFALGDWHVGRSGRPEGQ